MLSLEIAGHGANNERTDSGTQLCMSVRTRYVNFRFSLQGTWNEIAHTLATGGVVADFDYIGTFETKRMIAVQMRRTSDCSHAESVKITVSIGVSDGLARSVSFYCFVGHI